MPFTTENLEAMLRRAPVPRPPNDLKAKLLRDARRGDLRPAADLGWGGRAWLWTGMEAGWRRWLLLLVPTGIAAALATVAVVQRDEIREMRSELQQSAAKPSPAAALGQGAEATGAVAAASDLTDERRDIIRLRELLARLEADAATLARLETENAQLKASMAAARASMAPEFKELEGTRERADSIRCVNNLKMMGIAVRVYATDNGDEFPPNMVSMKDDLTTPKILVCPADTGRTPAESWESYSAANLSYEFLSPGPGKHEFEPTRVLFRCPIHGHIGMCDGSVQMAFAKDHPERLVTRNGALYMEVRPDPTPKPTTSSPPTSVVPQRVPLTGEASGSAVPPRVMSAELARRYGLLVTADGVAGAGIGAAPTSPTDEQGNPITVRVPLVDADGNVLEVNDAGVLVPDQGVVLEDTVVETEEPQP
jgi:hypothetical protein